MSFDFGMIPTAVMHEVFGKMDLTSLSRLRQTNWAVNEMVEMDRNRIKAVPDFPAILKVSVDTEKMILVYKVAYKEFKSAELVNLSHYLAQVPEEEYVEVESPLETLRIAKFDYVLMDFEMWDIGETIGEISAKKFQQAKVIESILPQLDHLRLICDWLCVKSTDFITHIIKDLLLKINFGNFFFDGPCLTRDVDSWKVQHCDQFHLVGLQCVPNTITTLINVFQAASVVFNCQHGVENVVKKFLLDLKEDPSLVGNLKTLSIFCVGLQQMEGIQGLEQIYAYYDEDNFLTVSKIKLEKGVVYLSYAEDFYDLKFEDEECDGEIIAAVCSMEKLIEVMEE